MLNYNNLKITSKNSIFLCCAIYGILGKVAGDDIFCMKPVEFHVVPQCGFYIANEGARQNASCIEDNVFRVIYNRTREASLDDGDTRMYEEVFEGNIPQLGVITCKHSSPIHFEFDGIGALEGFRAGIYTSRSNFTLTVAFFITPDATGGYTFRSYNNSIAKTSIFVFAEGDPKAESLVGKSREWIPAKRSIDNSSVTIPCISADLNATVTLFKPIDGIWTPIDQNEIFSYDRKTGFTASSSLVLPGEYKCSNGNNSESTDSLTFRLTSENAIENVDNVSLQVEIINGMAVCTSNVGREDLYFVNILAGNPLEAKILEQCLQRRGTICGSPTRHIKKVGAKAQGLDCPNNSTSCVWIKKTHPYGLLYCQTTDYGSSISQTYFSGLDDKIYTNTSEVPPNAMLRPVLSGYHALYGIREIQCKTAGYTMLGTLFTMSIKFANGSTTVLPDEFEFSKNLRLTTDMEELTCSGYSWETNESINGTVKVAELENGCHSEFTCPSNCIPSSFRCDGDNDCGDMSDEVDCFSYHCERGGFKCSNTTCIPYSKKCDNVRNCPNGEDETAEACKHTYCSTAQFKCASGQCVPGTNRCDFSAQCLDRSDEANCTEHARPTVSLECVYGQFKCATGRCIRASYRCDNDFDCGLPDRSDEENCSEHFCLAGGFRCSTANETCIRSDKKCNNIRDCPDGSDEIYETCKDIYCSSSNFKCASGHCVGLSGLCDGVQNCLDESDESNCTQFHPEFLPATTDVTFNPNVENELVCEITNVTKFPSTISWWRRGLNLSIIEPSRVWYDGTGLKRALRFPKNLTLADKGEYICIAVNRLHTATQVFTVTIELTPVTTTTSTEGTTTEAGAHSSLETVKSSKDANKDYCECNNTAIVLAYFVIISIAVIIAVGFIYYGWKYYQKRNKNLNGIVRMRSDRAIVLETGNGKSR